MQDVITTNERLEIVPAENRFIKLFNRQKEHKTMNAIVIVLITLMAIPFVMKAPILSSVNNAFNRHNDCVWSESRSMYDCHIVEDAR